MRAENDVDAALAALHALRKKWAADTPSELCEVATTSNEHKKVEEEPLKLVAQLKDWRRIHGRPYTLDELLDPKEEREIGESLHAFGGGDVEIIRVVQQGIDLERGEIEEIEEIEEIDSDDEDPEAAPPPLKEMIIMCRVIEENCMVVCTEGALEVVQSLRRYRGHLWRMSTEGAEQTTLDAFFSLKSNWDIHLMKYTL